MKESKAKDNKNKRVNISDGSIFLLCIALLLILFLLQPRDYKVLLNSINLYSTVVLGLKTFILNWLLPFTVLIVAILTYRNILLTKQALTISQGTLKQMQLSDQKNTAPLLSYKLFVSNNTQAVQHIKDIDRPREIVLWSGKADAVENAKPHYLMANLKNMQEHPQGVAIAISLKINLTFPFYEGKQDVPMCTETIDVPVTWMDAKETYDACLIKVSGIPSLTAQIESITYRDMFKRQYVYGYGQGYLKMEKPYETTTRFIALTGQSPDEPSVSQ